MRIILYIKVSSCPKPKIERKWVGGYPPIGAPKATDIPAAEAAERISRFLASFVRKVGKNFMKMFAQQHATWIRGPSLPSHNPEATARH